MDLFQRVKRLEKQICCVGEQVTNIINNPPSGTHPTYVPPALVLTSDNPQGDYESGTIFADNNFDIVFTANDAGPETAERLIRTPGGTISNSFPYDDVNYQVIDGNNVYQAQVDYGDGIIKNNSFGIADPTGQILVGTKNSNTLTYTGMRLAFWQAIVGDIPVDSTEVRSLANSIKAGEEFIINIPVGTVHVVFALPDTLTVTHVEYIELSNSDIKAVFDITNFTVEGNNGYSPIGYDIWSYTPVEPFPVEVNYRVRFTL